MKFTALILLIIHPIYSFGQKSNNNIIKLPLTFKNGYGPFGASLSLFVFESTEANNSWSKTYLDVIGIPKNWKNVKKGTICFDVYQFVYQNYSAKNISPAFYNDLQQSWKWIPDKPKLSFNPLKCYVYVATGEDDKGKIWTIIDANNNLDFGDDNAFIPVEFILGKSIDSLSDNAIQVNYERLYKGKIIQTKIPLLIVNVHSSLWYTYPQYAVAYLKKPGIKKEIAISSGEPNFSKPKIILINDTLKIKKAKSDLIISNGEYVSIDNTIYKNKGVDFTNEVLELEKVTVNYQKLYSTQVNFKAIPFEGKEFIMKEVISLDKYKGKFLFIDFWGTWCGPCVNEIPNIKTAYEKFDKSKIEFLGIVGGDNATSLKKFIEKEKILWPQILSDETNKIVEAYRIAGYPTSFLINPEGIIIAKNLRGEDLYNVITKLMTK